MLLDADLCVPQGSIDSGGLAQPAQPSQQPMERLALAEAYVRAGRQMQRKLWPRER